ncbi:MAG: GNAT family N-acetyltransferase [Metallibacterium scheffleri]|jgi:GNAT superfamily N-acetyltransferase|nr:GNAT family N-acetyltransferase [Pseudomonadota bacterium]
MSDTAPELHFRLAEAGDEAFILSLAERLLSFDLPTWRKHKEALAHLRGDLRRHLLDEPPGSYMFIAEDNDGEPVALLHLQKSSDLLSGKPTVHISDLAVPAAREGQGIGRALLAWAEDWAREHGAAALTLNVFPGNTRAQSLYARNGFQTDLLKLVRPLR